MVVISRRAAPVIVAFALAAAGRWLVHDREQWWLLLGGGALVAIAALAARRASDPVARALPLLLAALVGGLGAGHVLGATAPGAPLPWLALAGAAGLMLLAIDARSGHAGGVGAPVIGIEPLPVSLGRAGSVGVTLAMALALAAVGHLVLLGKRHDIPGIGPVFALDDDMMITLRYAANLAHGDGLVWNAGEHVEGITNLLWALLLAPLHWLFSTERVAAAAIALDLALLLLLLIECARLVRQLGGSSVAAGLAAIALSTHQATLHWVAGGGESPLVTLLLLFVARRALAPATSRRGALVAATAAGLAWITRPDALPALLPLLALLAWSHHPPVAAGSGAPRWRHALAIAAAAAALPLAATLFRLAYYGSPLPNTYYLKMTGWNGRADAGFAYVAAGLAHHFGFAAAAAIGATRLASRGALALLLAVLLHGAYVIYAGGDELPMERFLLPTMPFVLALGFAGASASMRERAPAGATAGGTCAAAVAAFLLLALGTTNGGYVPFTRDPAQLSRASAERANTMIGYLLRANTAPDATVAHFWAGAAAYFSQRRGIDLLGKCDPVIARREAKAGLMKPGHNKYDFAHSLALQPDVIVGGDGGAATLAFLTEKYLNPASPHHGYRAFADLYRHPDFANLYCRAAKDDVGRPAAMPQLVGGSGSTLLDEYADVSRRFHALFVRAGSTRARPPAEWTAPTRANLR